jgi:hypothetical protein
MLLAAEEDGSGVRVTGGSRSGAVAGGWGGREVWCAGARPYGGGSDQPSADHLFVRGDRHRAHRVVVAAPPSETT